MKKNIFLALSLLAMTQATCSMGAMHTIRQAMGPTDPRKLSKKTGTSRLEASIHPNSQTSQLTLLTAGQTRFSQKTRAVLSKITSIKTQLRCRRRSEYSVLLFSID